MPQIWRSKRRRYKNIMKDFLATGNKFQLLEIGEENFYSVKALLEYIISYNGWRKKLMILNLNDSFLLVNRIRSM